MVHPLVLTQILKQLPPSGSQVRCWDVGGLLLAGIVAQRPDVSVMTVSVLVDQWPDAVVDTIVAYDVHLTAALLHKALAMLRPGGRLVIANPAQAFDTRYGDMLTQAGYVRLLLEPLDTGSGLMLRGERPHTQISTLERIQVGAATDADTLTLDTYRGRFVHLLVQQSPNKPVWKLTAEDQVVWQALRCEGRFLTFTSLPKSVAFMQRGVLNGRLRDINKVAKFRREIVADWPVLLNPAFDSLALCDFERVEIDRTLAEAPDE